jgi:hypothetical protein
MNPTNMPNSAIAAAYGETNGYKANIEDRDIYQGNRCSDHCSDDLAETFAY